MVSSSINYDLHLYSQEDSTEVASAPSLGLDDARATFVAIMLDFSVETAGSNTTLLHWVLPGLSSNGATNLSSQRAEIAPYFPPGPPAGQTHTYGILLYNEPTNFAVPENFVPFFKNLTAPGASVLTRIGFNLTNFVVEAGLGAPVAADWFLVRNATMSSTTTTTSTSSRAVSATNTGASTGSTSSTSSNPLTTQSASDAMTIGIKSIVVAFGALWFVVSLL